MHAVMKLSNNGDEFWGAAVFHYDSPKPISAEHVKCLGQINMNQVQFLDETVVFNFMLMILEKVGIHLFC